MRQTLYGPIFHPTNGQLVVGGRTGSSELASGNSSFFSEVDFAWAGPAKIEFEQGILLTPKKCFSFKSARSGTENGTHQGGVKSLFLIN